VLLKLFILIGESVKGAVSIDFVESGKCFGKNGSLKFYIFCIFVFQVYKELEAV